MCPSRIVEETGFTNCKSRLTLRVSLLLNPYRFYCITFCTMD